VGRPSPKSTPVKREVDALDDPNGPGQTTHGFRPHRQVNKVAGFNTQFHATLSELEDFIETWLDQHPIVISAFAFPPLTRVPISRDTVRDVLERPDVDEVVFTHAPVDTSLTSGYDVGAAGYEALFLNIGRTKSQCLEQSSLSTGYDDPIWKKINRDLKRKAPAGAEFVQEATGARGYERNFRFTAGAKALAASGTPLRQFSGASIIFYPK
jgi:hypothetical protein